MADARYMLDEPGRPGAARRFLDQTVIPGAIDAAGCMEAGLERLAVAVRGRPAAILGGTLLLGLALGLTLLPRRRRF